MKVSWKCEEGHLVCRWSQLGEDVRYNPPWMQEASNLKQRGTIVPSFLDFTRLSPFGGRTWYDPNRDYGSVA